MGNVRILDVDMPRRLTKAFQILGKDDLTNINRRMNSRLRSAFVSHSKSVIETTLATTKLEQRRGRLKKKLRQGRIVFGAGTALRLVVTVPESVAVHEFGATILPKRAQKLAIPQKAALRADGSPKFKGPNSWKRFGSFIFTNRRGNSFVVRKKGSEWIWLYSLVDKAKIKPQLGLRLTWNAMLGILLSEWGSIMVQEMAATNIMGIPGTSEKKAQSLAKGRLRTAGIIGIARRGFRVSRLPTRR